MRIDPCCLCLGGDDEGLVLLCDGTCDRAFHAHCVGYDGVVEGDWLCEECARTDGLDTKEGRRRRPNAAFTKARA